jgi:hypothetical protein
MLSNKLITREEIREYKQLSKTANDDRLNDIIIQVQLNELRPLIGERLFNAVMNTPESYEDLLNGSTYTHNNLTYQNYGLKAVLAYYIDAYWKMFGDATSTPFGTVTKLNQGISEPISDGFRKSMFTVNKQSAFNIWLNVQLFLRRTNEPLYDLCDTKRGSFRINKIDK